MKGEQQVVRLATVRPAVSPLTLGNGETRLAPMAADSLMSSAKLELISQCYFALAAASLA